MSEAGAVAGSGDGAEWASLRERIGAALDAFLQAQREELAAVDPRLEPVVDAAAALVMEGGKRLRPAFCYWGWRGAGGGDCPEIVVASAALELLHASALVHDDLMDASDLRRGRPAVHRAFASAHRDGGWRGDPGSFGAAAAILIGDLCLIWADAMLHGSGLDEAILGPGLGVYDAMRVELMAGQYLDVLEGAAGGGSVERALQVASYKSARYTVARPLELGGALAGAAPELMSVYRDYGLPLGQAFQLRDDVLGVFGDPAETGKPAGDDLREGKRTVLVALAVERADAEQAAVLGRELGHPDLDAAGVTQLRRVIVDTGALREVETMIEKRLGQAMAALQGAPLANAAAGVLAGLALAATARTT